MKKIIDAGFLIAALALMAGCSTWGNGKVDLPFAETPYQAGRTFVFIDTITEPFQPLELSAAIDQVYAIASISLGAGGLLDEAVQAGIDQAYSDSTPETRAMIFNIYKAIYARIEIQIEANPEIPKPEVFSEFFRGVEHALLIYQ